MLAFGLLGAVVLTPLSAQDVRSTGAPRSQASMEYFFHRPDVDYGSAATWGPLGLMGNRGLSILQFEDVDRDLTALPWRLGFEATWDALSDPGGAVARAGGWRAFLDREFVPSDWEFWTWAWAPNYSGHLLAGGISFRQLAEWFDAEGVAHPWLAAGVWYYATMTLNEAIENRAGPPGPAGAVADMYLFDPAGMILFGIDGVARFFAETLQAADWSPQVGLTPEAVVLNHGQMMAYKVPLMFVDRVRLLLLIGQGSSVGASVAAEGGYSVGAAIGFAAKERFVDPVTGAERITPRYGGGLYLDRNGSLLASVALTGRERLEANVYPGVMPGWLGRLGVWGGLTRGAGPSFGLSTSRTLGLGFGLGR